MLQLMSTVQLLGATPYDTQIVMHTGTCTSDVSLARQFKKNLSSAPHRHGVIDQGTYKNGQVRKSGQRQNIIFKMMLMLCTKM